MARVCEEVGRLRYGRLDQLSELIEKKLVSKRPHPSLPLDIYNYTAQAQHSPIAEWTEALKDCRGLILDRNGEIVGRPFRKFWNYHQCLDQIPPEPFSVWEKLDGSLGIACSYAGELVCATRGSFGSDQARWFDAYMKRKHSDFLPDGTTYLFEIVYPANRIVVDYGDTAQPFLLAVMAPDAVDLPLLFDRCERFAKARRYDITGFSTINSDPQFAGQEGFVVQWASGFRAKVKLEEYKRLHRLITQCSTRTIWEMLRTGADTQELLDRVPAEFGQWARQQISGMAGAHVEIRATVADCMATAPPAEPRKEFALWAKAQKHPNLLFAALDGKDITDSIWRLIEPRWSTPFRKDFEG